MNEAIRFSALKDELMEHIKAGLNLPEGEEMPSNNKKTGKHILWRSAVLCGS